MKVVALSGGTGSSKLVRGLAELPHKLSVVCNVGDDFDWHGLAVCPDLDVIMYALAGTGDPVRGWGLRGDSFGTLAELRRLGAEGWFQMGDRDLATSVLRTELLGRGLSLTEATERLRRMHNVRRRVYPVTDDPLQTFIRTPTGEMHLQEFWVRDRGRPRVLGVSYRGSSRATLTGEAEKEILAADRVVICPANPVTSIGPMLAVGGVVRALRETRARVTALSPFVGKAPFSGPAGKLMKATGRRADSAGVASAYSGFLDVLLVDAGDAPLRKEIEDLGVGCSLTDISLSGKGRARRVAQELLAA